MRKPIIAGNWKMFKTRDEALYFVLKVSTMMPDIDLVDSVILAPAPMMRDLVKRQGENLRIGAQNLYYEDEGAYTGEVSGQLLASYNVDYVVIGHSERRNIFGESDADVNKKIKAALRHDLKPIVCVGEHLSQREAGETNQVLSTQITNAFAGLSANDMDKIVIAYEPIWAIGTGKTATADMADESCGFVRTMVEKLFNETVAQKIRIQYGGSVKPENIDELLSKPNIDGALIGGASLDPDKFIYMAQAALKRIA